MIMPIKEKSAIFEDFKSYFISIFA